jgi:subfamily B ATP-binding cassette protein MsbA
MPILRRVLGYLRPYKWLLALSFALMAAYAVVNAFSIATLIPFLQVLLGADEGGAAPPPDSPIARIGYFLKYELFAWLSTGSSLDTLRNVCLLIMGIYLLRSVLGYFQNRIPDFMVEHILLDVRRELFAHTQKLSFRWYQKTRAGHLLSILANDVGMLAVVLRTGFFNVGRQVLEAGTFLIVLFALSWKLTLVALAILPPVMWIVVQIAGKLRRVNRQRLRSLSDVTSTLQENIGGMRIVRAFAAEAYERERFNRDNEEFLRQAVRSQKYGLMGSPVNEFLMSCAVVLVLYIGGRMILLEGELSPANFIIFLFAAVRFSEPVKILSKLGQEIQPSLVAAERIFEILDTAPEVVEVPRPVPITGFHDRIEYEDVSFAYEDLDGPVLHDVSFSVAKGEVVALVGPSGGGKSTIVDLLPRFYDPQEGRILFDGVDLRQLRLTDLRRQLGIVTQETILFHDTVGVNIAYGQVPDRDRLISAARTANALEFIEALPQGFETLLGERGVRLSGGQRQRIAIARALYKNPSILIFDEATSALDTESEVLVQQAISRLMEDRTAIVIAHRLSTVQRADRILVIDGGRIVEQGTHSELLASEGRYSQLYELQFAHLPT